MEFGVAAIVLFILGGIFSFIVMISPLLCYSKLKKIENLLIDLYNLEVDKFNTKNRNE